MASEDRLFWLAAQFTKWNEENTIESVFLKGLSKSF